jgi:signal transduction histidine kinase
MLGMVGDLNEQQAGYVAKIEQNIESISQLSMEMLDLERLASSRGLRLEKLALKPLIAEVVTELEPRSKQKKISVLLPSSDNDSAVIEADSALLKRAIYNLLDNAIRVSSSGAKVEVKIAVTKDTLTFSVSDQGPGIAPVDQPKIFTRESLGQTAGLAIVRSVIERHKGKVSVQSELGVGSTFHCEFPKYQP